MVKQKDTGICGNRIQKTTRVKITVQLEEIKPKSSGERREVKEISTKSKTIQTKKDIPKQRKKILSRTGSV